MKAVLSLLARGSARRGDRWQWMACAILLLVEVACAPVRMPPRAAPVAASAAVVAASTEVGPPQLIEVRLLVIAYAGAQGAPEAVVRDKQAALERAKMLSRMARGGDKLAELVRRYSDRPGAAEDLGLFRLRPAQPGVFGAAVSTAASALHIGDISDAVEGPEGFFVIERRGDPPQGPQRIAARHILISYKGAERALAGATRSERDARALAEQIARKAKEPGADWADLAAQFTDEPGSKATGGDLGRFGHGQMVKAFEAVAFGLAVGEISDVVATPFGFHVIQRYE